VKKRLILVMLCVLFLLSAITATASCGETHETDKNNPADTPADKPEGENPAGGTLADNVPEGLDFGGYGYRIFYCVYAAAGNRGGVYFYPESEEGEVLNDTLYKRNRKVQDRFNVKFLVDDVEDSAEQSKGIIAKNVKAGDDAYDMYMLLDRNGHYAASNGFLYPIGEVPYIDFERPYWLPDMNRHITIAGKLPWAFSDEVLSLMENLNCVYFNKKMTQDLGLGDLYALVKSGDWTIDRFLEFAKTGTKDTDGDGKMTAADIWGMVSQNDHLYPNFWISAGIQLIKKNQDDIPYFDMVGNERFFSLASKVVETMGANREGIYLNVYGNIKQPDGLVGPDAKCAFFKNGSALFAVGNIQEMIRLRDMEDDFGVVPFPKYDAAQNRYHCRIEAGRPFVIPATNQRPEIAGAVMEAMACETRNTVFGAYYEYSLQNKFARDPDTVEMLDLIRESAAYDICDTIWCMPVRVPLTDVFAGLKDTFASWAEKNTDKVNKNIDKLVGEILDAG